MIDHVERQRFERTENGLLAFANYRRHDDRFVLTHVEVDVALRGTGAAGRLMEEIVAAAREQKFHLAPRCSYALGWFARHPQAADVLG